MKKPILPSKPTEPKLIDRVQVTKWNQTCYVSGTLRALINDLAERNVIDLDKVTLQSDDESSVEAVWQVSQEHRATDEEWARITNRHAEKMAIYQVKLAAYEQMMKRYYIDLAAYEAEQRAEEEVRERKLLETLQAKYRT